MYLCNLISHNNNNNCYTLPSICRLSLTGVQHKIIDACHDDTVGGCHFGRDKTVDKVTSRYYWKKIYGDVEHSRFMGNIISVILCIGSHVIYLWRKYNILVIL